MSYTLLLVHLISQSNECKYQILTINNIKTCSPWCLPWNNIHRLSVQQPVLGKTKWTNEKIPGLRNVSKNNHINTRLIVSLLKKAIFFKCSIKLFLRMWKSFSLIFSHVIECNHWFFHMLSSVIIDFSHVIDCNHSFFWMNWIVFHFIPHGNSEDKRKKSRARQKKLNGNPP